MNPSPTHHSSGRRLLDPIFVGTLFGIFSAVSYTAANICLRAVATDQDPFWVSSLKPVPTFLLAAPVVLWQAWGGTRYWMSRRAMLALAVSGLFGQVAGNVAFQWSLGVVGMAICVPVTLGALMIGGAVLGRISLGEQVTVRSAVAMLILIGSIIALCAGSGAAHASVQTEPAQEVGSTLLILAVGAAALAGFAYAILGVVIRRAVTGSATLAGTLLVVAVCGLVSLFPISFLRIGMEGIRATGWHDLSIMLLAGVFNALAFFSLSNGLRLITVVHFNLLNASQTAMAALAGLIFFQEALTAALVVGVAMTVGGLLLIEQRKRPAAISARHAESPPDSQESATHASPSPPTGLHEGQESESLACQGSSRSD